MFIKSLISIIYSLVFSLSVFAAVGNLTTEEVNDAANAIKRIKLININNPVPISQVAPQKVRKSTPLRTTKNNIYIFPTIEPKPATDLYKRILENFEFIDDKYKQQNSSLAEVIIKYLYFKRSYRGIDAFDVLSAAKILYLTKASHANVEQLLRLSLREYLHSNTAIKFNFIDQIVLNPKDSLDFLNNLAQNNKPSLFLPKYIKSSIMTLASLADFHSDQKVRHQESIRGLLHLSFKLSIFDHTILMLAARVLNSESSALSKGIAANYLDAFMSSSLLTSKSGINNARQKLPENVKLILTLTKDKVWALNINGQSTIIEKQFLLNEELDVNKIRSDKKEITSQLRQIDQRFKARGELPFDTLEFIINQDWTHEGPKEDMKQRLFYELPFFEILSSTNPNENIELAFKSLYGLSVKKLSKTVPHSLRRLFNQHVQKGDINTATLILVVGAYSASSSENSIRNTNFFYAFSDLLEGWAISSMKNASEVDLYKKFYSLYVMKRLGVVSQDTLDYVLDLVKNPLHLSGTFRTMRDDNTFHNLLKNIAKARWPLSSDDIITKRLAITVISLKKCTDFFAN